MSENNQYKFCFEAGLSCEVCTSSSARELAAVCQGLRSKAVSQLFVQMYPDPSCSRMLPSFVAAYKAASSPMTEEAPERKGLQTEIGPRTAVAAA